MLGNEKPLEILLLYVQSIRLQPQLNIKPHLRQKSPNVCVCMHMLHHKIKTTLNNYSLRVYFKTADADTDSLLSSRLVP